MQRLRFKQYIYFFLVLAVLISVFTGASIYLKLVQLDNQYKNSSRKASEIEMARAIEMIDNRIN
ncbi:MAG: hypothetical protein EP315_00195, partial [Gammaproteobacteria bacterium]